MSDGIEGEVPPQAWVDWRSRNFARAGAGSKEVDGVARRKSPLRRISIERCNSSGSVSNLVSQIANDCVEWKIDEGDIDMSHASLIGEGASGQIFRANYQGAEVAVKVLRREEGDEGKSGAQGGGGAEQRKHRRQHIKDLVQEVRASCALAGQMADLYHPNVAQLIGATLNEQVCRVICLA